MKRLLFSSRLAVPAGTLLVLTILTSTAHAGGRSTVVHGSRGAVYQRHVHHTPGSFHASGSVTRRDGRTASRSFSTQATGTGRTTHARVTGFDGRSAAYDAWHTRTDHGFERQVSAIGPNGGSASKRVSVVREGGTTTRSVTRTRTPPPQ